MARIRNILIEGLEGLLATSEVLLYSFVFGCIKNFHHPHPRPMVMLIHHWFIWFPDVLSPERSADSYSAPGYPWEFWLVCRSFGSAVDVLQDPVRGVSQFMHSRWESLEKTCLFCLCPFGKNTRARNRWDNVWAFHNLSEAKHSYEKLTQWNLNIMISFTRITPCQLSSFFVTLQLITCSFLKTRLLNLATDSAKKV